MLKKIIVVILAMIAFLLALPSYTATYEAPVEPVKLSVSDLIAHSASKYKVKEETLRKVIFCESSYNENAVGDGGKSFGLVQIHLPSHPYVSKAQALDPEFAIDFFG